MDELQQGAIDRATWPVKEPGPVMMAWRNGVAVTITEAETNALLVDAVAPRHLPLSFGSRVQLQPHERCEWAYRALAALRNERLDGERL